MTFNVDVIDIFILLRVKIPTTKLVTLITVNMKLCQYFTKSVQEDCANSIVTK